MIKCKKCESELPDSYKYCIYCSARLPQTEQNSAKPERKKLSITNILVAVFAVLTVVTLVVMIKVLPW